MEVSHKVKLGEGIAVVAEVVKAPGVCTTRGVAGSEGSFQIQDRSGHDSKVSGES